MTREEAIKFYADEVLFLEIAPRVNIGASDEQKEEWKRQAAIHRMAIAALRGQDATDTNVGHKTNADHIRSMTDEQLGEFLGDWASESKAWKCDGLGECLAWLKQPHKEET